MQFYRSAINRMGRGEALSLEKHGFGLGNYCCRFLNTHSVSDSLLTVLGVTLQCKWTGSTFLIFHHHPHFTEADEGTKRLRNPAQSG